MLAVKLQKLCNVHIAHAIAVGHHKRLIPHIRLDTLDAPAGHGVQTGIHHCDLPRLGVVIMYGHFILTVGKIKGNVTGVQEVIREPLLSYLTPFLIFHFAVVVFPLHKFLLLHIRQVTLSYNTVFYKLEIFCNRQSFFCVSPL